MTALRVGMLVAAFTLIALGVVYVRTEGARSAVRALRHESEWINLRRELWQLQTQVARLRAPDRVHDRMAWLQTDLQPPAASEHARPQRLVSRHP